MSKMTSVWSVVWQVVEFVLTLGLSHIVNRKKRLEGSEDSKSSEPSE